MQNQKKIFHFGNVVGFNIFTNYSISVNAALDGAGRGNMSKISELQKTTAGTINIDWKPAEDKIGFKIHNNLKDFYSRILGSKNKSGVVSGIIKFKPNEFVKRYINMDNWLDNSNGGRPCAEFELYLLTKTDSDYISDYIQDAFFGDWTGGNDFGHRAYIGEIIVNIGQIYLIFNNDTGEFEWADFEYGYFDVYTENPYGIVADNTQEFLDKFSG